MKIGSKIRPRNGKCRNVTVHDRPYVFAATPDKNGDIHFVADVTDTKHAETFLGSGDFYAFGKGFEQQPSLTRSTPAGDGAHPATGGSANQAGGDGGSQSAPTLAGHDPEAVAAATELLKGSISDVGKAVANHRLPVIRAALAMENAQENARKGMVALLEATLEGAKQAGVEG